jgi:DNA-binding LytR/AlgR family response regulator
MKALIIEDEPHARTELKRLLGKVAPDVEVVAETDSVAETVLFLQSGKEFDLVFADIQLSDGLSFDIFSKVEVTQPVIFTTAYNEFAIKAFELNSIDYLLKPIEEKQLQRALDKLRKMKGSMEATSLTLTAEKLKELLSSKREYKSRFVIKTGDQFRYITTSDIAYFMADEGMVYAVDKQGTRLLVDYKMEELELLLNPSEFFRINRGCTIHIQSVQKVHKYFNSRLSIDLQPKTAEPVLVSRLKVDDFLTWMDQ